MIAPRPGTNAVTDTPEETVPDVTYSAHVATTPEIQPVASDPSSQQAELSAPDSTTARKPLRTRWIALKPGSVYEVTNYSIHEGSVTYVLSNGAKGSVDITEVDWRKTSHLNAEPTASSTATRAAITGGPDSFSGRP